MVKCKVTKRVKGDITTVTVTEFVPDESEMNFTTALPIGANARDMCGDGTDEFLHNNPLAVWKQFPVKYFIEDSVSLPVFVDGIVESFNEFNRAAADLFYERTTDESEAKIRVRFDRIDVAGRTLAQAEWSWRSGLELIEGIITFDSSESWGVLPQESCGATGGVFDLINVGVHEVGHLSGLAHAPTDQLQTMFASTSPGKTLGRSLGNGDIKGFLEAYDLEEPEPCEPTPCPPNMHFDIDLCECVEDLPPPPPPPVNRPPAVESFSVETDKNTIIKIELRGSDPDNDPITFEVGPATNGTVESIMGEITYTPEADFVGNDSFDYTATDDKGLESNIGTVSIEVKDVVLPPPPPPPPEPEECIRPDLPRRPTLEQIISFVAQMIEYIRCRQNQR